MIDSNNCGLWLTYGLKIINDSPDHKAQFDSIRDVFAKGLETYQKLRESTAEHKLRPALAWMGQLGLVKRSGQVYRITDAGRVIMTIHQEFQRDGYDAYRKGAGATILKSLATPGQSISRKLTDGIFEKSIREGVRLIKTHLGTPVEIPLLRDICSIELLKTGYEINDVDFDRMLLKLVRDKYYQYFLLQPRERNVQYPFPGIIAPRGSYFYVDTRAT